MTADITFFPEFNDVFNQVDENAKYGFFPLNSITINDHPELADKKFHVVSLWDSGGNSAEMRKILKTFVHHGQAN